MRDPADLIIAGGEDEVLEKLDELRTAGVTDFAASAFGRGDEIARTRELLRRVTPCNSAVLQVTTPTNS